MVGPRQSPRLDSFAGGFRLSDRLSSSRLLCRSPRELCSHADWRPRRSGRHFGVYLADFCGVFVKCIRLRPNKLSLDCDHIFQILGLAEFLSQGEGRGNGFGGVAHKFFVQVSIAPGRRLHGLLKPTEIICDRLLSSFRHLLSGLPRRLKNIGDFRCHSCSPGVWAAGLGELGCRLTS